jgi:transposase
LLRRATIVQAAAPERPIAAGPATPALLAQVLISKYCDHTPLYRQPQIFAPALGAPNFSAD